MAWIVRIFLVLAAPITALMIAQDSLNFGIIQFVAILLMVACLGLAALWSGKRRR